MEQVSFANASTYEPDEGWRRVSLAGSDSSSFEWFEKPQGHASPLHHHANERVCVCLKGELTVRILSHSATMGRFDSVYLDSAEPDLVENTGTEDAIGLDVFAPGCGFEYWTEES